MDIEEYNELYSRIETLQAMLMAVIELTGLDFDKVMEIIENSND